jgi:hypothetical protein
VVFNVQCSTFNVQRLAIHVDQTFKSSAPVSQAGDPLGGRRCGAFSEWAQPQIYVPQDRGPSRPACPRRSDNTLRCVASGANL